MNLDSTCHFLWLTECSDEREDGQPVLSLRRLEVLHMSTLSLGNSNPFNNGSILEGERHVIQSPPPTVTWLPNMGMRHAKPASYTMLRRLLADLWGAPPTSEYGLPSQPRDSWGNAHFLNSEIQNIPVALIHFTCLKCVFVCNKLSMSIIS